VDNPVLRYSSGVLAAVLATLIAAAILQLLGTNDYRWVVFACMAIFFAALLIYGTFQGFGRPPFKRWRVTNLRDNNGLLVAHIDGHSVGSAFQFKTDYQGIVIFGPYLKKRLKRGKYTARYRVKIDGKSGDQYAHVIRLNVASKGPSDGEKTLAERTLANVDFAEVGTYDVFPVEFAVFAEDGEVHVEFRIVSCGNGALITFDYVGLSRQLL